MQTPMCISTGMTIAVSFDIRQYVSPLINFWYQYSSGVAVTYYISYILCYRHGRNFLHVEQIFSCTLIFLIQIIGLEAVQKPGICWLSFRQSIQCRWCEATVTGIVIVTVTANHIYSLTACARPVSLCRWRPAADADWRCTRLKCCVWQFVAAAAAGATHPTAAWHCWQAGDVDVTCAGQWHIHQW